MERELQQTQYGDVASPNSVAAIEASDSENLPMLPPATQSESQWQQISKKIANFLEELPEYFNRFFNAYKQPLITIGWILAAIFSVKIILAVLDAINDIPLTEPLFELIGIGYAIWFTFRYLLKDSTRQELFAEIDAIKKQFVG